MTMTTARRRGMTMRSAVALGLLGLVGPSLTARAAEDDLAVVKRAVATAEVMDDAPSRPAPRAESHARRPEGRAHWLKVRVVDSKKDRRDEKVSIAVPLAVLALLDSDATVDLSELGVKGLAGHTKKIRVSELLESFEPGQTLVEVDAEDSHIRVWVE
jgi:hypothetical protein